MHTALLPAAHLVRHRSLRGIGVAHLGVPVHPDLRHVSLDAQHFGLQHLLAIADQDRLAQLE